MCGDLTRENKGRGEFGNGKILHSVLYFHLKPLASEELDGCDLRI